MKNLLLALALIIFAIEINAQTKDRKMGISSGAYIQHYNGDLGNSFMKFNTCCFGGEVITLGYYLGKTFDFNASLAIGDFGYCQTASDAKKIVPLSDRCPGCVGKTGMGDLRARMVSGNFALRYKLNNGVVLNENSKISPYIYAGIGLNYLTDRMKRQCVTVGYHMSLIAGLGIKYDINNKVNIGYNLGIGRFSKEKVYSTNGNSSMELSGKNDMYMQNSIFIGLNF